MAKNTKTATARATATKAAPVKTAKVAAANVKIVKNGKAARKVVPAKVAAAPAAWGTKSILIKELATRKEGFTAAEFKAVVGWKSVSAKAVAERFATTWGNEDGVAYKVVPVARKDGTAAYRWTVGK